MIRASLRIRWILAIALASSLGSSWWASAGAAPGGGIDDPTRPSCSTPGVIYPDRDGDLLSDCLEAIYGTDPLNWDTDGDGLIDSFDALCSWYDTDPLVPDPDSDGDGILDVHEYLWGTDMNDPDVDDDGMLDGDDRCHEHEAGLGVSCTVAWITDPDVDGDGLGDGREVYTYGTSRLNADTDGDGWDDPVEIRAGSDPLDTFSQPKR